MTAITRLLTGFRAWERPARIALLLALALMVVVLILASVGPESIRLPAVIGFGGLLVVGQVIVMWANRGMVAPYTLAQRRYLGGDLEGALDILEPICREKTANARELALLGNTYRQLGRLDDSERVLLEALDNAPEDYFPLYGFGRTLLSRGQYAEAADAIRRALAVGAPPAVAADLGEALFRNGDPDAARDVLKALKVDRDVGRTLMVGYLLYQLKASPPPSAAVIAAGLPYWQASAARFEHTSYGQALAGDVRTMQSLLKET